MAAKLTSLTQKIAIQLHLVAESCTICSSRSRRRVRKLLDILSYKANGGGGSSNPTHRTIYMWKTSVLHTKTKQ